MKIGILTIHCNYNYGALLQCYALQEYISSLGHDVTVINYRPDYLESKKPRFAIRPRGFKRYIEYNFKRFPLLRQKYYKFKKFECRLNLSDEVRNKSDLSRVARQIDYLVFGSDQIWCNLYNGKDSVWFGDIDCDNIKKISYAASAGDAVFSSKEINEMISFLEDFQAISVREEKLCNLLKQHLENKKVITCCLDPTLMVPIKIWEPWFKPIRHDDYLVVRMARMCPEMFQIAEHLACQLKCKVINADMHNISFQSGYEIRPYSPDEFVSLIKNARCVVTNSFHGTALAIVANTPFYTIMMGDDQDERSYNLLKSLGLEIRMINKTEYPVFSIIDYKRVNAQLNILRESSQQYLIDNLA